MSYLKVFFWHSPGENVENHKKTTG